MPEDPAWLASRTQPCSTCITARSSQSRVVHREAQYARLCATPVVSLLVQTNSRATPKDFLVNEPKSTSAGLPDANVALERDVFLRTLIRELSGTLQEVIGLEEASGFISVVGQRIGDQINEEYKGALQVEMLTRDQVTAVLVDLKRRIQGQFYVIEESDEKIVFGNTKCPFAEKVIGRPAMCMMTSNVFGVIAAENLGHAKVVLNETIAEGAAGCRVTVYLRRTEESDLHKGREYFKS